ncbi:MAG: 4-hydroxy-3-methylbut-2-enyl diphosphate reductase [Bacilli bacterium]|nr:4-hydroxy-3-methylbut-2-enyl diphosphate reductase [Bacilli bacterium]
MIEVGKLAGFCGGVTNSVEKTKKVIKEHKNIYCLGELVHNKEVIKELEDKGLTIIESLDEVKDGSNVIIRAHGVSKDIYGSAKKRNINLIDLTCPKVLKIHDSVNEYKNKDFFIILIGSKKHPEVIGTISFCGEKSTIIEDITDIDNALDIINKNNYKDIVIFAQTTFKESLFNEITSIIKDKLKSKNIVIENTICSATHLRQEECKKMSKEKDCMIIIGGKNSSNTKKLYEISLENCKNTYLIETVKDLNLNEINKYKNIGIMAGASTPKSSIDEVIINLQKSK